MDQATLRKARAIEKRYGSNYYLATLFFPRDIRDAVFVLYAFVRIPDEYVDNPAPDSNPKQQLEEWRSEWVKIYETGVGDNDIMILTRELFLTYQIPFSVSLEFIDAMIRDLTQSRYRTYEDLQTYMRGSADVVGIMMTHILGYHDERAFLYGEKLGEAMQFTNFLRDIYEDISDRDRIYIPQDDLEAFGVTETMLRAGRMTPELKDLMKFEIARGHDLFKAAEPGIDLLNPKARRAVRLASRFYEQILNEIEKHDFNIFRRQQKASILTKLSIIISTYVS